MSFIIKKTSLFSYILGTRYSSKSIDKLDGAQNDTTTEDNESVSSMEYYNTTTSQVRFAIDLDVSHDHTDSEDERWSWDKEDLVASEKIDEPDIGVYREIKTSENKNDSTPRSSRFSITKFPTENTSTVIDPLALNR